MDSRLNFQEIQALARDLKIDRHDIERRKAFLDIGEEDSRLLSRFEIFMRERRFQPIEEFYEFLLNFTETRRLLPAQDRLGPLKRALDFYLRTLLEGQFGWTYTMHRIRVAVTHHQIGLGPRWYTGGYRFLLGGMAREIHRFSHADTAVCMSTLEALQKALFLDLGLGFDVYNHLLLHPDRCLKIIVSADRETDESSKFRGRLLVVLKDSMIRDELVRELLRQHNVSIAETPTKALHLLAQDRFYDLIISEGTPEDDESGLSEIRRRYPAIAGKILTFGTSTDPEQHLFQGIPWLSEVESLVRWLSSSSKS